MWLTPHPTAVPAHGYLLPSNAARALPYSSSHPFAFTSRSSEMAYIPIIGYRGVGPACHLVEICCSGPFLHRLVSNGDVTIIRLANRTPTPTSQLVVVHPPIRGDLSYTKKQSRLPDIMGSCTIVCRSTYPIGGTPYHFLMIVPMETLVGDTTKLA